MSQRKQYTREFKLEVVRLMEESDKPITQLARELGIRRNLLYKWRDSLVPRGDASSPDAGHQRDIKAENARLRRELKQLKEERDILKKAAAYFAKELK